MIGINNVRAKEDNENIIDGIVTNLIKLRMQKPDAEILLLGLLPTGQNPDSQYRNNVTEINAEISNLASYNNIHYLDIGHQFLDDDGYMIEEYTDDFLHYTPAGYTVFADAILPTVEALLSN